ncbi:phosphoglucosamine mutase [Chitinophagales bacterium]|nr:phosphoglucosamine mutase [Chitinophagales bacterium]
MAILKTISGIRGTIGGKEDEGLTPFDIVKFAIAYAFWLKKTGKTNSIVIGRDARISGEMVNNLVVGALMGAGYDIVDLGLSTTPTVEMAVVDLRASGGIILTASHNPKQWNALKLLNEKGEFISADDGQTILDIAEEGGFDFPEVDDIGTHSFMNYKEQHIEHILKLPLVDKDAISKAKFRIVVDAVNSSGGIYVPMLLKALGVTDIIELNCEPTGLFAHNPEPLAENLTSLSNSVVREEASLGISVDPDVDRLALVNEDGDMFGEEYTLVAVADYILQNKKGSAVSNLSSSMALRDVCEKHQSTYHPSAVGEVNVVAKMKEVNAVIGGEGNGGIIYPELHYGRDALVGIALFLSHLAKTGKSISFLRSTYPNYEMIKDKIPLDAQTDVDGILAKLENKYSNFEINTVDGLKIIMPEGWVMIRKSNTEPIVRVYAESDSNTVAENIVKQIKEDIKSFEG